MKPNLYRLLADPEGTNNCDLLSVLWLLYFLILFSLSPPTIATVQLISITHLSVCFTTSIQWLSYCSMLAGWSNFCSDYNETVDVQRTVSGHFRVKDSLEEIDTEGRMTREYRNISCCHHMDIQFGPPYWVKNTGWGRWLRRLELRRDEWDGNGRYCLRRYMIFTAYQTWGWTTA